VVTFLTKKGIPSKQLIAKGYGKENPIASNTLENGKPDLEGMQKNRRVEIKIEDSK
jgi:outer membrane protein OmpA-like peptidoglycan-associated protein